MAKMQKLEWPGGFQGYKPVAAKPESTLGGESLPPQMHAKINLAMSPSISHYLCHADDQNRYYHKLS